MKTKELKKIVRRLMNDPKYKEMNFDQLSDFIGLKKKKDRQMLTHVLKELEIKQKVEKNPKGDYKKAKEKQKITGILQGNQRGFGFVIPDDTIFTEDIFIPERYLHGALDQDHVWVKLISEPESKKLEGEVVEILERGHRKIIGRYEKGKNFGFVIPDNNRLCRDIFIPDRRGKKAETGDKVVVNILSWSEKGKNPEGEILEILGKEDSPGIDVLSVIKEYDIPMEFSKDVKKEAAIITDKITDRERDARKDLRKEAIFTIDGEDAKDYDDAVSIRKKEDHYILGVHIADVSHYVRSETAMDASALERGTSVYALDRVVPMLPFKLSNKVCSLLPDEERLSISCEMEINEQGQVVHYKIFKSVIKSKARMTYEGVAELLDKKETDKNRSYVKFKEDLEKMAELAKILHDERRVKRGAINFDFPEAKIYLDDQGFPNKIETEERLSSHRMIEEFMLLCNETVAKYLLETKVPFLFRNHPIPDQQKLTAFRTFLKRYDYALGSKKEEEPKEPEGKDFQKLMAEIKGKPEAEVITLLMLRTMQQAVYQSENHGHYALGANYYTHFTSPIRRYPDLFVHRYLSKILKGKVSEKSMTYLEKNIDGIAKECSEAERRAERIEREIKKMKMTEYMSKHLGEVFSGRISGVTSFGFFVELPNTIEGLVRLQDMNDDFYLYDPELHRHVGERAGKIYDLGAMVQVKVTKVNVGLKQIDFELLEN